MAFPLTVNQELERTMQIASYVDYAPHLLEVRSLITKIHELLNDNKYEEARELALHLQTEAKLLNTAVASRLNES